MKDYGFIDAAFTVIAIVLMGLFAWWLLAQMIPLWWMLSVWGR